MNRTGSESARDAVRAPDGPAMRTADGESVETALQLAIDLHGPGLLNNPDKLRLHLEAQCPHAGFDLSFLLVALEEKVPQSLLAMNSVAQMQTVVPQLQEMLAERRGLNPFAATWAVSTWAAALRMDLFDRAPVRAAVRSDVVAPAHGAEATTAPHAFTVPFGVLPVAQGEARGEPPVAPVPRKEPDVPSAVQAVAIDIPQAPPIEPASAVAIAATDPIAPAVEAPAAPEIARGPADPIAPAAEAPATPESARAPADPVAAAAPPTSIPTASPPTPPAPVLPAWAAAKKKAPRPSGPQRFNPLWGVGGLVAAVVVAVVTMRMMASMGEQAPVAAAPPPVGEAVAPPSPAPAPVADATPPIVVATPPVVVATAPIAAPAVPSIVGVISDDPLPGDGQRHDVFVALGPARSDVRSIETTFVSGDVAWEPGTRVIDVQPDAIRDGRIAIGPIALRTTKPVTATFRYVATTVDGTRSMPFIKQFVFAPVAARPPVITDVVVPAGVVAGTPFTLTIDFTPGESGIASVERTTVGQDGPARTTSLAGLASPKEGTLRYPVEAIASASRTTFAITLVDRDGARSEPKRIVVEAAAAKRAVEKVAEAPQEQDAFVCTRATCGTVVSAREIDRTKTYEVIARMDDRTIRTMVSTATWKVGTRVRRAGSRLAPIDPVVAAPRPKATVRAPLPVVPESPPIFDR